MTPLPGNAPAAKLLDKAPDLVMAPPELRLGPATLAWVTVAPLVNRFRQGEGALLAVNLSLILATRPSPLSFAAQALVSTLVLALLYLLNDLYDCRNDLNDAGKDQAFVRFCVEHRARLFWLLGAEQAGAIGMALALLGPRSALAVAAVFLVNLAYSAFFKGRAAVDVLWVALWGACYAMVPAVDVPPQVLAVVGVMTSICHVFQITRDRPFDVANGVRTSAVAVGWLPTLQLAVGCLAMGLLLAPLLGPAAAASAAAPLLLRLTMSSNQRAWLLSKAYYGVVWLLVLRVLHAS